MLFFKLWCKMRDFFKKGVKAPFTPSVETSVNERGQGML